MRLAALALTLFASTAVIGQTATVHTAGLTTPNKIIKAPDNSLIVSEAGTRMPNTGRLSIIDRTTGARHTLISGLPSAVSFLGGATGDPDGPSGIVLRGNRLLVTTGVGDSVLPGGGPGLETPNPAPSSPIFNSVLEITLPGGFALLSSPFVLTPANQTTLDGGTSVTLTNAEGVELTIRLVADLPDWRPAPRPDAPNNVKASHLYGIETFQRSAYLADAGHNEIKVVDLVTGDWEVLVAFPPRANPTPMGGPFIEAVPSNVHRFGNRLLVPLLTGFPFVPGLAEVRRVNLKDGAEEQFIGGLTSAMDIAKVEEEDEAKAEIQTDTMHGAFVRSQPVVTKEATENVDLVVRIKNKGEQQISFCGCPSTGTETSPIAAGSAGKTFRSNMRINARTYFDPINTFAPGDGSSFYTLEFSTNMLAGALGRLRFYQEPTAVPVNVLTNLVTPTSMTRDAATGNIFITNIGPGTVTKVTFP